MQLSKRKIKSTENKSMFLFFAIIGWLYEMSLFFVYGTVDHIYNRGFLVGPYLPIYGFGMLLLLAIWKPLKKKLEVKNINKWAIVAITILMVFFVTTGVELISSYLIEAAGLDPLWDYSYAKYNFQGRVSLNHSIRFALGGTFCLYILYPIFEKLIYNKIKIKNMYWIIGIIQIIMFIDLLYTIFYK